MWICYSDTSRSDSSDWGVSKNIGEAERWGILQQVSCPSTLSFLENLHLCLSSSTFVTGMASGRLSRPIPLLDDLESDVHWDPALPSRSERPGALFERIISPMGDEVTAGKGVADWLTHPVVR